VQLLPDPPLSSHGSRGHSSAGRAPALQAGGRRFDPGWLHQLSQPGISCDQRCVLEVLIADCSKRHSGGVCSLTIWTLVFLTPNFQAFFFACFIWSVAFVCEKQQTYNSDSLGLYGQANKRIWWMPRRQKAMKDVVACEKPRGAGKQASIRGCPNGETHRISGISY
jgi:hypothetical protein